MSNEFFFQSGSGVNTDLIPNSLRFRGSNSGNGAGAYLFRNNTSGGDRQVATFSYWWKHSDVNTSGNAIYPFVTNSTSTAGGFVGLHGGAQSLGIYDSSYSYYDTQNQFRDPSAWYHIVYIFDTNNSNADDRVQIYSNGVRMYRGSPGAYTGTIGQGKNYNFGSTVDFWINRSFNSSAQGYSRYDGYMAEFHYVNGTIHQPTVFGEYNDDGVWIPKKGSDIKTYILANGGYGGPGHYLDFSDINNIGADRSGNGNNWTAYNFSFDLNSRQCDFMEDSPTKNYPTINALYNYESTMGLFEANLKVDTNSGSNIQAFTTGVREGKYYAEIYCDISNSVQFKLGITDLQGQRPSHPELNSWVLMFNGGGSTYYFQNGGWTLTTSSSQSWNNGDLIGLALDADNSICYLYKNGTLINTIDFSSYITPGSRYLTMWHGYAAGSGAAVAYMNAGQRNFVHSIPAGYEPLVSAELPEVEIKNPKDYFNVLTYTGNGGTQSITGCGFQPDIVWIKLRSQATDGVFQDSVRGNFRYFFPRVSTGENTNSQIDFFRSFDEDGFTVAYTASNGASYWETNLSGNDYVAWCWKKAPGILDIVEYTGNGGTQNISHNLGKKPAAMWIKNRYNSDQFMIYNQGWTANYASFWSPGSNFDPNSNYWNNTEPTATQFTLGNATTGNRNGDTYIAYLFADVPGFFAAGKVDGNGSTNGTFVYTGFRPAFVIWKNGSTTNNWFQIDSTRDIYNPCKNELYIDSNSQEQQGAGSSGIMDFTANGFKLRSNYSDRNGGGNYFSYFAWAEHPFGGDNVSPSTAR